MIIQLRVFLVLCCASVMARAASDELNLRLRDSLRDVDRIVLQEDAIGSSNPSRIVLELSGADVVRELGALVDVEERVEHCLCITSPVIKLYAGPNLRFTLTLHHAERLRDENGPWLGDVKLTSASAERFRNWFSQKGYNGFVEAHVAMLQAQAEHRAHEEELRAQFPAGSLELPDVGNYLGGKERDDRITRFRGRVPEPSRRILACWRGLGSLQLWAQYRGHPAEFFLLGVLENEAASDALQALHSLQDGDKLAWLGAFYHFMRSSTDSHEKSANEPLVFGVRDEAALMKLVQGKMAHDLRDGGWPSFMVLKKYDAPLVREWLVGVARGSLQLQKRPGAAISHECWALLLLAKRDDQRVKDLASARLRDPQIGEQERRALEVVLARIDPSVMLTPEHLALAEESFAEEAWRRLEGSVSTWPLDALVAVHDRAENYEVRWKIEALFAARGLRFLTEKERLQELWKTRYEKRVRSLESTRQARADVEATGEMSMQDRRALLAKLLYHEGRHLNRRGDYAAARSCLIQADRDEVNEELVIACLGLGLLDQAYVRMPNDSPSAELLRLSGFVAFARGDYEDAAIEFDTAVRLDVVEQSSVLFAHLAYVLAGKSDRSRLRDWADPFGHFGALADEDGRAVPHWPDSAILHLQGKLPWSDLRTGVHEMRGESRALAAFSLSVISRINGDRVEERAFLDLTLDSKAFTSAGYLLAALRVKELETPAK